MPRPDKRFVRYPRSGEKPTSGAGDDATPKTFVKGRYATVPQPADPQRADPYLADPAPGPTSVEPLSDDQVSKYDRRAGGVPVRRAAPPTPSFQSPTLAAPESEASEVVVDLRETTGGFEAVYRRRPIGRDDADEG